MKAAVCKQSSSPLIDHRRPTVHQSRSTIYCTKSTIHWNTWFLIGCSLCHNIVAIHQTIHTHNPSHHAHWLTVGICRLHASCNSFVSCTPTIHRSRLNDFAKRLSPTASLITLFNLFFCLPFSFQNLLLTSNQYSSLRKNCICIRSSVAHS